MLAIAAEVRVEGCQKGDIRLEQGSSIREGIVQVCINHAWGTICDQDFHNVDAGVICSQLNFERDGQLLFLYKTILSLLLCHYYNFMHFCSIKYLICRC